MNKYNFTATINNEKHYTVAYGENLNRAREEAGWILARKFNISVFDISKLKEENEKMLSVLNFKMGVHKAKHLRSEWYYYLIPRRLTFPHNPHCYKWMFWWIAPRKSE